MNLLHPYINSKQRGDAGLGIAIGYFASKGFTVLLPLTDSQDYDLVIDTDNGLKKVQVKTTIHKSGNYFRVELRTKGGNKSGDGIIKTIDKNSVDFVFIVTECGTKYLIPTDILNGMTNISLGEQYKNFLVN